MPLAMITWLDGGAAGTPTPPIYYPPSVWPSPGVPAHPIYNPPGIWPSPGVPTHPIAPGGPPPGIWPPGSGIDMPTHPIAPGGPPPSIWPSPGRPTHPIYYPPGIWGGANEPFPTPPIYIGPPVEKPPADPPVEWHAAWSPATGWIVVGVPTVPVPTPST